MARTTYHFSKYPRIVVWIAVIVFAFSLGAVLYHVIFRNGDFRLIGQFFPILGLGFSMVFILTSRIDIDDESGMMTYHNKGKVSVNLKKVDRIARHVSAKDKLRYATFHEVGVQYVDFPISPRNEDAIMALIRRVNPDIEIVTYKV